MSLPKKRVLSLEHPRWAADPAIEAEVPAGQRQYTPAYPFHGDHTCRYCDMRIVWDDTDQSGHPVECTNTLHPATPPGAMLPIKVS